MIEISIQTIRHLVKSAINQNENHQVPNIKNFLYHYYQYFCLFKKAKLYLKILFLQLYHSLIANTNIHPIKSYINCKIQIQSRKSIRCLRLVCPFL